MNLYQLSASSPYESSWACYCENEAVAGGIDIGFCLGDEFSCRWMENSAAVDFETTTIGTQTETVISQTEGSIPAEWGWMGAREKFLKEYQGDYYDQYVRKLRKFLQGEKPYEHKNKVKASNALLAWPKYKAQKSNKDKEWAKFHH